MLHVKRCLIVLLLFSAFSAWADELIIEPDQGRAPILKAINDARYSLNLVMYGFTDQALLDALVQQKSKGKTLKVILEQSPYKAETENTHTITQFNSQRIAWHGSVPSLRLIHQKTLIIDDSKAIIMTFNFTHSTFKNERNFALVIDDAKKIKAITAAFSADWNHLATSNHSPDLIFSPDDSRQKLLTLIDQAKHTIHIYAQTVSDYKIVGALAKAAKSGVKVIIITSGKVREKQADYLARAGVQVHQSKHLYIHAKAFIFDEQKAVIGSINLTRNSLDHNRELAVMTTDAQVIKALDQTFNTDLQDANTTSKTKPYFALDQKTVLHAAKMLKKFIKPLQHLAQQNKPKKKHKYKKEYF